MYRVLSLDGRLQVEDGFLDFRREEGQTRGNREYLDRMADLGLVECLRTSKVMLTPTYRNTDKRTVQHQMDHLFVTRVLAERMTSCDVGLHDAIFDANLSDHLPVIANFDFKSLVPSVSPPTSA